MPTPLAAGIAALLFVIAGGARRLLHASRSVSHKRAIDAIAWRSKGPSDEFELTARIWYSICEFLLQPHALPTGACYSSQKSMDGGGMSKPFDFSAYLDDEIARNERILKSARQAASVPVPNEFNNSEIVGLIERHLDELKGLRAQQERRHASPT